MECNIDDMSGEISGYVMDKLFQAGALDVFYSPIYMKKNRPAIKLTVLSSDEKIEELQKVILNETTTLGIRKYKADRVCMERELKDVATPYGIVKVKISSFEDIVKYSPEYEDCRKIAEKENIPLKDVYNMVIDIYKM